VGDVITKINKKKYIYIIEMTEEKFKTSG